MESANRADSWAAQLRRDLRADMPATTVLAILGPRVLALLTCDGAIALDREALADTSGETGLALAAARRQAIQPLLEGVFLQLCMSRRKPTAKASLFADIYYRLLVGDLQIRRLSGGLTELKPAALTHRAEMAQKFAVQLMNAPENA